VTFEQRLWFEVRDDALGEFRQESVHELEHPLAGFLVIDMDVLKAANLVPAFVTKVKVIKSGKISKAVKLKGLAVTKGARVEIEKAGGSIED
jgi:large subunit ribosomal protein L15